MRRQFKKAPKFHQSDAWALHFPIRERLSGKIWLSTVKSFRYVCINKKLRSGPDFFLSWAIYKISTGTKSRNTRLRAKCGYYFALNNSKEFCFSEALVISTVNVISADQVWHDNHGVRDFKYNQSNVDPFSYESKLNRAKISSKQYFSCQLSNQKTL